MTRRPTLILVLVLAGCTHAKPPATPAHYTLGEPYQLGAAWYYPRDQAEYAATGLAAVTAAHDGPEADGERYDPAALAAAHRTLQLPAIARVTNLETGSQVLLRLTGRGPADPGRLLGLTPHAAALLGAQDGTRIRVELDEAMTRALTSQVGGGPRLDVAAAPRSAVTAEQLAPLPGSRQSTRARILPVAATTRTDAQPDAAIPDRLPDQVTRTSPSPGQIILRASEFGRVDYANRQSAQLAGLHPAVERLQAGRATRYRVRAGPFPTVAAADAALGQALRAGVKDSILVVE